MLKVNSSRAGIVGKLNNMPDAVSFTGAADAFNHLAPAAAATQTLSEVDSRQSTIALNDGDVVKDTTHHGFELDIDSKAFMLGRGFLSLPTLSYDARIGALEESDRAPGSGNPIADEGAVSVVVGGSFSGNIDFAGDTDDIRVFLVAGQTYLISLRGTGATPVNDTFLEVYNPSAALVNFDDDGGIGINSFMTITATATGNYTIRASSFSNPGDPGLGGYTVDVRVQGVDAVGDTNATAVVLSQGTTFGFRETATVSGGNDLDRYEVQLEAGKFYTFKVAAGADYATDYTAVPAGEIDTILRLRNAGGTLVAQNDDNNFPTDISSGFGFLATATGTYYLDVTGYAGQTGGYVIDFQNVIFQDEDPLQSIRWVDADNIDTVTVNGAPTAYVYFGAAGETFGEPNLPNTWGWNAVEKAAVMSALLEYTKITGITYLETADINQAEFRLQTVSGPNPPVSYGAYFYPQDPGYGTQQGIGVFNINSGGWDKPGASTQNIPGDQVSLNKGGFSYAVILHEFGHAHGLAHPHDNGGGSDIMLGVTSAQGSYGIFNLNQGVYTVMSYNDAWDFHPDGPSPFTIAGIGNGWSGTLGAFDIAALQERYGVHDYNTGDNLYVIAATQQSGVYYETIWDTGGNDTIAYSGTGNARIDLTAATLDYSPTGAGVVSFVDQIPGTAGADGIWGGYTIANGVVIENATGGSGADVLIGNSANNVLDGRGGVDIMMGRGGDDIYFVENAGDAVTETFGNGSDLVYTTVSYTLTDDIERLVVLDTASVTALNLTGNARANEIKGNDGANIINGGGDADVMTGLGGDDIYLVDNTGDIVQELSGGGTDTVYTTVNYTIGLNVERLGVNGLSTTFAVDLTGNALNNEILGNNGANVIDGKAGADIMTGYGGNDTYLVDDAGDVVFEFSGGGTDSVITSVSYTIGDDIERLSTSNSTGTDALNLTGNARDNQITGNNGANMLDGKGGSDVLVGGGGADTFAFTTSINNGIDQILDFQTGSDKIALAASEFAGLTPGALSAGAFVIGSAAGDADDRIIYNSATGALYFDADGNGAGAAVQFATLSSGLALTANDFTVI